MKPHCKYRGLLPAGHAAIDVLLLAAWIWHAVVVLNPRKAWSRPQGNALAAYAQSESIGWSPSRLSCYREPDPRFALILTGTLPAGIVSVSVRPEAGWQTRHRLWDPIWFVLHEAVAIPLWFLIGTWIDSGRSGLVRLMGSYLAGRIALALLAIAIPWNGGVSLQILFWLGLAAYGALRASRGLLRSARSLGSA
jgi:hypothetical protein